MYFILQMSGRQPSLSIVEYFAENSGYRCGYCGQEDTNYSHGMWAHTLTTQDYQVITIGNSNNYIFEVFCIFLNYPLCRI